MGLWDSVIKKFKALDKIGQIAVIATGLLVITFSLGIIKKVVACEHSADSHPKRIVATDSVNDQSTDPLIESE